MRYSLLLVAVLLAAAAGLVQGSIAAAQAADQPQIEELPKEVTLYLVPASSGYAYRGSIPVTLVGKAGITNLRLECTDLVQTSDPANNTPIPVTITPPDTAVLTVTARTQTFDLETPIPDREGTYKGSCEVDYDDRPDSEQYTATLRLVASPPKVQIDPGDRQLKLQAETKGGSYKASFTLRLEAGELSKLLFSVQPLNQQDKSSSIFADKVTVAPDPKDETLPLNRSRTVRTFTVVVQQPTGASYQAGTYEGNLLLVYTGTGAQASYSKTLTLRLEAAPDAKLEWTEKKEGTRTSIPLKATTSGGGSKPTYDLTLIETNEVSDARLVVIRAEDLRGKDDSTKSLPDRVLAAMPPSGNQELPIVASGGSQTIALSFDFGQAGVDPGTYSGFVRVESENADLLRIPLEITLRNPFWPWPCLVLVLGLVLGLALNAYSSQYRERDQIEEKVGDLQELLGQEDKNKTDFYKYYGTTAKDKLKRAYDLLKDETWTDNKEAIKGWVSAVRTFWVRWRTQGAELAQQAELLRMLKAKLISGGQYCPFVAQYAYLEERLHGLINIEKDLDTYDPLGKLIDAVKEEQDHLYQFELAFERKNWAELRLGKLPQAFPSALKRALEQRLADQDQSLKTKKDDTDIKTAETQFKTIGDEIEEAATLLTAIEQKVSQLRYLLDLDEVKAELQSDERSKFDQRLKEEEALLPAAKQKADLEQISQRLDTLRGELQTIYQQNRLYYYRDCRAIKEADQWIKSIDNKYIGWTEVRSRLEEMKSRADVLFREGSSLQTASYLMFYRWRIAWFYREAVGGDGGVYQLLGDPLPVAVKTCLREDVNWLLDYQFDTTPSDLDKVLLDKLLEPLYKKVNEDPKFKDEPVHSPFAPVRPVAPAYRPLPPVPPERRLLEEGTFANLAFEPPQLDFVALSRVTGGDATLRARSLGQRLKGWIGWIPSFFRWLLGDPGTRLFLFGFAVQVVAIVILVLIGWEYWNSQATFGSSGLDYFYLFFAGFAGTSTTNTILTTALTTLKNKNWGAITNQ
jgi:hypothetical protein